MKLVEKRHEGIIHFRAARWRRQTSRYLGNPRIGSLYTCAGRSARWSTFVSGLCACTRTIFVGCRSRTRGADSTAGKYTGALRARTRYSPNTIRTSRSVGAVALVRSVAARRGASGNKASSMSQPARGSDLNNKHQACCNRYAEMPLFHQVRHPCVPCDVSVFVF